MDSYLEKEADDMFGYGNDELETDDADALQMGSDVEREGEVEGQAPPETQPEQKVSPIPGYTDEEITRLKGLMPFVEEVKKDPLMRNILTYKAQGQRMEDIIEGMFYSLRPDLYNVLMKSGGAIPQQPIQQEEESPPEFATTEEEIKYYSDMAYKKAKREYESKLEAMENKLNSLTGNMDSQRIVQNNNRNVQNALSSIGLTFEELSQEEIHSLDMELAEMAPGFDYMRHELPPKLAKAVVTMALAGKKPKAKGGGAPPMLQGKLPNTLPGAASGTTSGDANAKGKSRRDGYSRMEQQRSVVELLKSI